MPTSLHDPDCQLESRAECNRPALEKHVRADVEAEVCSSLDDPCRSLFGQAPSAAKLHVGHDFWGFKEGAPETVIGLAQTSDGFLWLATPTGLFRFDGTRFELFHSPFGDHLLSTNIYSLFAPPSGGLWIGYMFGGFSFFKDGRVTNYGETATGTVQSFGGDKDGIVWAAATSGLWKFDGAQWQHLGSESNVPLGAFSEARFDREGTLWALTGSADPSVEKQLFYLRPGSRQFETAARGLIVGGFTLDADGYVVTSAETKPLLEDASANAADRPAAYPVLRKESAQIIDRRGSVWIIPQGPVLRHEPASGQRLSEVLAEASPGNSETYDVGTTYNAKLVDREGSTWFGDPKGIHRLFYSPLTKQDLAKSANGNTTYFTVTPDDAGTVWILASDNARIFDLYFVVNGLVKLRKAPGPLGNFAFRDPDRTIWLGGTAGLWRLVKGDLRRVDLPREMADQAFFLQTITRDRRGGMWVSFGRHGLYRLADGVWASYGGREDLPKTGVVIEFTDSRGRVWFGYTKNTLAVLDGDRVQVFGPNEDLAWVMSPRYTGVVQRSGSVASSAYSSSTTGASIPSMPQTTHYCVEFLESSKQAMVTCGLMAWAGSFMSGAQKFRRRLTTRLMRSRASILAGGRGFLVLRFRCVRSTQPSRARMEGYGLPRAVVWSGSTRATPKTRFPRRRSPFIRSPPTTKTIKLVRL